MAFPQNDRIIINESRTRIEKVKIFVSNKLLSTGLKEIHKKLSFTEFQQKTL